MRAQLRSLWSDESGQAMVEYGVIVAVVAVAALGILMLFWDKIDGLFGGIATELDKAPGGFKADLK